MGSTGQVTMTLPGLSSEVQLLTISTTRCSDFRWSGLSFVDFGLIRLRNFVRGGSNLQLFTLLHTVITIMRLFFRNLMLWDQLSWMQPKLGFNWGILCWNIFIPCLWKIEVWVLSGVPSSSNFLLTTTHILTISQTPNSSSAQVF